MRHELEHEQIQPLGTYTGPRNENTTSSALVLSTANESKAIETSAPWAVPKAPLRGAGRLDISQMTLIQM